jgi:hypothetical protein
MYAALVVFLSIIIHGWPGAYQLFENGNKKQDPEE